MKIDQRYATAVRSRDLAVDAKTTRSDSDVLGAVGLADRSLAKGHDGRGNRVPPCKLAVPLARLLCGDNHAAKDVVNTMATMAHRHSHKLHVYITRIECHDMAKACLAWFRHGACRLCGGHGKLVIPGTRTLGDKDCDACHGIGRVPFMEAFRIEWRVLANWLACELERALGRVGPQAMAHLAPRLNFDEEDE